MAALWGPSDPSLGLCLDFGLKLVLVGVLVYVLVQTLDLSPGSVPEIHNRETELNQFLLKTCPLLSQRYVPPRLWGRCGHLQTWLYAVLGRVRAPHPRGHLKLLHLEDGSTVSFHLYVPQDQDQNQDQDQDQDCSGGFCSHSEQRYVRTFVDFGLRRGFRCAVLNLLGAPPAVPLTTRRVFSYGCTLEFSAMIRTLKSWFPETRLVLVGFSLGGNIVCKYLGEDQMNQDRVLCGLSVCQGYSALRSQEALLQWTQGRRLYNYILTSILRRLLLQHRETLFTPDWDQDQDQDLSRLFRANSLSEIDDLFIRRFQGYSSLREYYETESCEHFLHNVSVPLLLVNSWDDPLVPPSLLDVPRLLSESKPLVTFLLSSHGGHLGFFEGGPVFPETVSWIDKVLLQYTEAICRRSRDGLRGPWTDSISQKLHLQPEYLKKHKMDSSLQRE